MAIYDFRCTKCDKVFEKMLKTVDEVNCACGGKAEKLIGSSAFVLSGSGWYSDGYGLEGAGSKE